MIVKTGMRYRLWLASIGLIIQFGLFAALHGRLHECSTHRENGVSTIQAYSAQADHECPICSIVAVSQIGAEPYDALPFVSIPIVPIPFEVGETLLVFAIERNNKSPPQ